jgi:hypothetical protein
MAFVAGNLTGANTIEIASLTGAGRGFAGASVACATTQQQPAESGS